MENELTPRLKKELSVLAIAAVAAATVVFAFETFPTFNYVDTRVDSNYEAIINRLDELKRNQNRIRDYLLNKK